MCVGFTEHGEGRTLAIIHGEPVEVEHQWKYLGTVIDVIDAKLRLEANTEVIVKKCQQLQHFLRRLDSFGMSRQRPQRVQHLQNTVKNQTRVSVLRTVLPLPRGHCCLSYLICSDLLQCLLQELALRFGDK